MSCDALLAQDYGLTSVHPNTFTFFLRPIAVQVRQRAREEMAEAVRREKETTDRLEMALNAERATHHRCAAKLAALEKSILDHETKAIATARQISDMRSRLGVAAKDVADAQNEARKAQGEIAAAQQRQAIVEAAAEERDRLSEQRGRTDRERTVELEDQLRELVAASKVRFSWYHLL